MLKNILSGWIGLNNTVPHYSTFATFHLGKEYQYKCDYTICSRPTNVDDLIYVLRNDEKKDDFQEYKNDYDTISQNFKNNRLYNLEYLKHEKIKNRIKVINQNDINAKLDPKYCRIYESSSGRVLYVPQECIKKLEINSVILNHLDNKSYVIRNIIATPIHATNYTTIYQAEGSNIIHIIFGFGSVPKDIITDDRRISIICFISKFLIEYLQPNNIIVLCGHSNGIVNAFFVADTLRFSVTNNDDIINFINNKINNNNVEYNSNEKYDKYEKELDEELKNSLTEEKIYIDSMDQLIDKTNNDIDNYIKLIKEKAMQYGMEFVQYIDSKIELLKKSSKEQIKDIYKSLVKGYNFEYLKLRGVDKNWESESRIFYEFYEQIYDYINKNNDNNDNVKFFLNWFKEIAKSLDQLNEYNENKKNGDEIFQKFSSERTAIINKEKNEMKKRKKQKMEHIKETNECLLKYIKNIKKIDLEYLRNNIYICGSAGYPCFGHNLIDYDELKKFYKNKILHFRLSKDRIPEQNMNNSLDIYRSDLIEMVVEHGHLVNIIFHDSKDLMKLQKNGLYDARTMDKDEMKLHDWSTYSIHLATVYKSDILMDKLNKYISITENLHGGKFYNKYIKNKSLYLQFN